MKKFILCADNFGKSKDFNRGILNGYNNGFIKSASIIVNGEAYEAAINDILPECQKLCIGIQLNLTDGKAITDCPDLTGDDGGFNKNFSKISKLAKNQKILDEIEKEFRAQIEQLQSDVKLYHICSNDNIHIIPEIFKLICKLAIDYQIPYIRTLREELYFVPDIKHMLNINGLRNFLRLIKYNSLSNKNKEFIENYSIKTNKYIIGIGYEGIMDSKSVSHGLKNLADEDDIIVECVIKPCSYLRNLNDRFSMEFKMSQDKVLEDTIYRMGYEITNHKKI